MMIEPSQVLPAEEAAAVLGSALASSVHNAVDDVMASGGGGGGGKLGRAVRAGVAATTSSGSASPAAAAAANKTSTGSVPEWALDELAIDADPAGEHAACRLHSYNPRDHPSMAPSAATAAAAAAAAAAAGSACAPDDAPCAAALADASRDPSIPAPPPPTPECADGYVMSSPAQQPAMCVQRCPAGYGLPTFCGDTLTCVRAGAPCPRSRESARKEVPFWCAAPGELVGGCAKQEYQVLWGREDGGQAGGAGGSDRAQARPPPQAVVAAEAVAAAGVARPALQAAGRSSSLGRRLGLGGAGGSAAAEAAAAAAAEQQQERLDAQESAAAVVAAVEVAAQEAEEDALQAHSAACRPGFSPLERQAGEGDDAAAKAAAAAAANGVPRVTTCLQRCPTGFLDCGQWCAMPGVACDGTGGQGTSTPAGFLPVTMVGGSSRHGGTLMGGGGGESGSSNGSGSSGSTINWHSRHSQGPESSSSAPPSMLDLQQPHNVSSAAAAAALVLPGRPMPLCKLAVGGCSLAAREQGALRAACAAAGHPSTSACPMALRLHGGCGGQRLHAASGARRGAAVRRIEAWWGVQGASAAAGAEAGADAVATAEAQAAADSGTGGQASSLSASIDQDAVLALRLTYSQGGVQVLGNATLAGGGGGGSSGGSEPPRAVLELAAGETIARIRMWRSRTLVDGATMTPVLGGFEIITSRGKRMLVGGGKDAAPGSALRDAAAAAAPRSGRSANAAAAADDGWVSSSDRTLVLDQGSAGLGTGVMVGAAAYTSPSAVGSLGFLFMRGGSGSNQQRNGGEL
jgi:hypothetical protein